MAPDGLVAGDGEGVDHLVEGALVGGEGRQLRRATGR